MSHNNNLSSWPILKTYDQDHLLRIAMPIGGIGTGTVSLGGRGNLQDWEIVNRPAKGFTPKNAFFTLYVRATAGEPIARVLEGPIHPSRYEGAQGCDVPNHGLPRFQKCRFGAAYPLAQLFLDDPDVPVEVRLEAFNPLIPTDAEASSIPVAVLRYVLINKTDEPLAVSVCGSLQNFIGVDGSDPNFDWVGRFAYEQKLKENTNQYRASQGLRGIYMASNGLDAKAEQYGTIALSTTASEGVSYRTAWANLTWGDTLLDFWDDFKADGALDERDAAGVNGPTASLAVSAHIPPKGSQAVAFLLTWHFPNRQTWTPSKAEQSANCGCESCDSPNTIGNYYATQYADAWDVAVKTAPRLAELEERTVEFVSSFIGSDLPVVVKEAALFNLSTLRSQTSFRTTEGLFYGWEGCNDYQGCCHGSCTHVWNYEQATPFLFGSLARSMREVEFKYSTDDRGHMSFRSNLPLERATEWETAAADGQMGCIMKLYRDWQLSGDDEMLRTLWPKARKALEFCWITGGWDADQDGVMEGCQHNTMDVEYFGPNPQMGGWYLGALRAAQEMADYLGEPEFAAKCRDLFERGSRWLDAHLFNGEYYEHEIRPPVDESAIAPGIRLNMGARNLAEPELQLGAGCLVDQLVGQYMAHVCGLGYLLDSSNVRTTLRSLMKYNFKRSFTGHFNHLRSFVLNDEAAMVMATYPKGRRPRRPFPYYNEVMTGFEYSTAAHMIYEGQVEDGLTLIKAIRDRYDGFKRSPFDEAECGHHYARAMASWAAVLALSGFRYSGVAREMQFAAAPSQVRMFWSTGDAWGVFQQKPAQDGVEVELEVKGGSLSLRRLTVAGTGSLILEAEQRLGRGQKVSGMIHQTKSDANSGH